MEVIDALALKFGDSIKDVSVPSQKEKIVELSDSKRILDAAKIIGKHLDALFMLMVVDRLPEIFEMNYVFFSYSSTDVLVLRTKVDREKAKIDSLANMFKSAEWEEREAYDMFGITFNGHPNLKRLLLPEDWPGRPLRKDFIVTEEVRRWTGLDMKF